MSEAKNAQSGCTLTHPLPPLKRGISGCTQILRRDAPLDDRVSENDKKKELINHES